MARLDLSEKVPGKCQLTKRMRGTRGEAELRAPKGSSSIGRVYGCLYWKNRRKSTGKYLVQSKVTRLLGEKFSIGNGGAGFELKR